MRRPEALPSCPCRSELAGKGLEGTIPPGGYSLPPTLQRLGLAYNSLTGAVPEGWQLPANLTWLALDHNSAMTGSVPRSVGFNRSPTQLQYLWLSSDNLHGAAVFRMVPSCHGRTSGQQGLQLWHADQLKHDALQLS